MAGRPGVIWILHELKTKHAAQSVSRLNESLWTLVIASITAFTGYAMVIIASRIERQRQERHAERFGEPNLKR
jgi:ABC-type spermidine/putrescine transport system permease subunit II